MDSEGACQTVTEQMTNWLVTSTPYWARPQNPHLCGHCLGIVIKLRVLDWSHNTIYGLLARAAIGRSRCAVNRCSHCPKCWSWEPYSSVAKPWNTIDCVVVGVNDSLLSSFWCSAMSVRKETSTSTFLLYLCNRNSMYFCYTLNNEKVQCAAVKKEHRAAHALLLLLNTL